VDSAFELELGEHPLPRDRGHHFLEAADIRRAGRDHLDPPALSFGIALIHSEEIASEQRGLITAGAGAYLEHRRPVVGRVAGKELERKRPLGGNELGADILRLLGRHVPELRVLGQPI
jgi:hypothetical protein